MAISLSSWKSSIHSTGTLPLNSYVVVMSPPVGAGDELQIRTDSCTLPGTAFMSVDNFSPYGNGKIYNIPYKYNPQEITMTHIMDNNTNLLKIFNQWSNKIVDLEGTQKFGAKYMEIGGDGYVIDFDVMIYNDKYELTKTVKIIEAFPIVVEPISMNWGTVDDIARLSVSYRFTRYEIN